MIAYASRKLKVHEKNYPTHDFELAAVALELAIYVYLKRSKSSPKKWLDLLKDYDISVLYHPGKENVVADALSRLSMGSVAYVDDESKELI